MENIFRPTTHTKSGAPSNMSRSLIRLIAIIESGSLCAIAMYPLANIFRFGRTSHVWLGPAVGLLLCLAATAFWLSGRALKKVDPFLDDCAKAQAIFLDTLDPG